MIRVMFLDFDGVLASYDYIRVTALLKEKNPDKYGYSFDPRCVKVLKWILEECPEVKIVVTSTWKGIGLLNLLDMWKIRDLPGEIIGITPELPGKRGKEIAAWLAKSLDPVEKYVIIDDDTDMLEDQKPYFVKTDPMFGLTIDDCNKVIKILKG
jgi:hypothetical protein